MTASFSAAFVGRIWKFSFAVRVVLDGFCRREYSPSHERDKLQTTERLQLADLGASTTSHQTRHPTHVELSGFSVRRLYGRSRRCKGQRAVHRTSVRIQTKQPTNYGQWSHRLLIAAWLLILSPYWGGLFFHVHGAEAAMGAALYTSAFGCYLCIPIVFIALTGLLRREKPTWPAVVGLIGSAVPAFWAVSWLPGWLS